MSTFTGFATLDSSSQVPVAQLANAPGGANFAVVQGSAVAVDMKSGGATILFTVPTGKTLYLMGVFARTTLSDTITVGATVSIGGNASSYNDWLGTGTYTCPQGTGTVLASSGIVPTGQRVFNSGDSVVIKVVTGATAVTLNTQCTAFGYLF